MRINTKVRYGLRTAIELALNEGTEGLFQKDISVNQSIPLKYLDKIVASLKVAGIIVNVGGKKSGYKLARKPEQITVYDIYSAFEPSLSIIHCLEANGKCSRGEKCASREYWDKLNTEIEALMIGKNIKNLAERQNKLDKVSADNFEYQI